MGGECGMCKEEEKCLQGFEGEMWKRTPYLRWID